jgi:hypothetical protein
MRIFGLIDLAFMIGNFGDVFASILKILIKNAPQ